MVPSGDYLDCEEPDKGCGVGCGVVVVVAFLITMFGAMCALDSVLYRKHLKQVPQRETLNGTDTCSRIKDTMCVYKAR